MKKLPYKNIIKFIAGILIYLPCSVFAASISIEAEHSSFHVGDTIIFSVLIDSEKKEINTIEGSILLDHPPEIASLVDVNVSNSGFSVWPNKPLPTDDNTKIYFTGGIPRGLNNEHAIVFNLVLRLQEVGQIILKPDNINVYLNDGKGTKDRVETKSLIVDILPIEADSKSVNNWNELISSDQTPPESFEIYLSQNDSVFDGKKFISFNTKDTESGIKYYEVKEGNLSPVISTNTYVLQEQENQNEILVTAFDAAGNKRESIYKPSYFYYNKNIIIAITLLIILIITYFFIRKRKNGFIKN